MSKRFTGITPFVKTSRGLVECLPHHADYWVPVIDGSPEERRTSQLGLCSPSPQEARRLHPRRSHGTPQEAGSEVT